MGYDPATRSAPVAPVEPAKGASPEAVAAYMDAYSAWYAENIEYQKHRLLEPQAGALRMNVGGAARQLKHETDAPHDCAACDAAAHDLENPRDHCAAHDHVIRTEAP